VIPMSEMLAVANWEKYQHYKDRNPPWIKLHFSLLTSRDWVMMSDASRVLAIACMLIASRNDGKVPNDPEYIKRVAYLSSLPKLKPLIDSGFLIRDSAYLADDSTMQAEFRPESETETETEKRQRQRKSARAREESLLVLEYLNKTVGRNFKNASNIEKCIRREKASIEDCKAVIDYKWREWGGGDMAGRVDNVTLWRPEHFAVYLDHAQAGSPMGGKENAAEERMKRLRD